MFAPASASELSQLMRATTAPLALVGAGTRCAPRARDARARELQEVALVGLDRIVDYDPRELVVVVECGVRYDVLAACLADAKQRLLVRPLFCAGATIGGLIATDSTGASRRRAGGWRDQVLGLSFVTADGALCKAGGRVVKNVAGYDLTRVLVGSHGCLAAITQVALRVHPAPQAVITGFVECGDVAAAAEFARALSVARIEPAAVLVRDDGRVAILIEGPGAAVTAMQREVDAIAPDVLVDWRAGDELTTELEEEVSLTRQASGAWLIGAHPRPARAGDALAAMRAQGGAMAPARARIFLEPGTGECHVFLQGEASAISASAAAMRAILESAGGALSVLEGDVRLRRYGARPAAWPLMAEIKRALDPEQRMNPGVLLEAELWD